MNRPALPTALAIAGLTFAAAQAAADTRIEKDLKLAPGGEFRLETDLGAVTVTGSPDSGAHIVVTSKRKDLDDLLTFRWEEGSASATVIAKKKHPFSWFGDHGGQVQYEIRVPAETRLSIDTSGGSIEASFTKGNSKGGTLETSGGGIEVSVDPEADLSIQASGNSVKTELPIRVQGEISRGSLSGSLGKGGNTLKLHTSGGSVRIQSI
jgi:hypothetical protein